MSETQVAEKPPRDPTVPCPNCANLVLYTNYYDKCYQCGRNISMDHADDIQRAGVEIVT